MRARIAPVPERVTRAGQHASRPASRGALRRQAACRRRSQINQSTRETAQTNLRYGRSALLDVSINDCNSPSTSTSLSRAIGNGAETVSPSRVFPGARIEPS